MLVLLTTAMLVGACHFGHTSTAAAGIGQEVRDGAFAFIVTHVDRAPTLADKHAQGVYVIV
ncbi:MAG TPA: hypothetical protein VIO95_12340, partial [Mycobacterium sp.]